MPRSLWGWGEEEAALEPGEVRARVEALLGPCLEEAPRPPRVPAGRVEVPAALAHLLSAEERDRALHARGKSYLDRLAGFTGDFSTAPDVVARPRSEDEVARVLEWAEAQALSATPFGGGTSVVGGVEPRAREGQRGTLSLDVTGLAQVLEVDEVSQLARIQAGALGPALEGQLATRGLTLRHYPQSFEYSTLGGWIATRAGGHFATGPTHIDELVHAVRLVTPRGLWATSRVPASGAGPDPVRLLCGSEGTLGVVTEAWMRVRRRPAWRAQASVHFERFEDGIEAARALAQSGLQPANARLLDGPEAFLNQVTADGTSVLVVGFEGDGRLVEPLLDEALTLAARHHGTVPGGKRVRQSETGRGQADAGDSWRGAFLRGPYLQDALIRLGLVADTLETACTWTRLPALLAAVRGALQEVMGGGVVTCRFTHLYPDGPAPYFTFLFRPDAQGPRAHWQRAKEAATQALRAHGGTTTHHHAVGRLHRPWYDEERPALFGQALAAVKQVVDPGGVLNPGVLFDFTPRDVATAPGAPPRR